MSTALEAVKGRDLAELTLDELGVIASQEHGGASEAAQAFLHHAIAAGHALLEARKRVEPGNWTSWVESNTPFSVWVAQVYQRMATYQDYVIEAGVDSVHQARKVLHGLPDAVSGGARASVYPEEIKEEARSLRKQGFTLKDIGRMLGGIGEPTIYHWTTPGAAKKTADRKRRNHRRAREAQEALKREERAKAAKRAGGPVSHASSALRQSLHHTWAAIEDAEDREAEVHLRSAYDALTKAEDEIAKALRVP